MSGHNGIRFYTISQFLQELKGRLNKRMLEYIRDTIHLIPPPIKISRGKGVIALYPHSAVEHIQCVLRERQRGLTYKEIRDALKEGVLEGTSKYLNRNQDVQHALITLEKFPNFQDNVTNPAALVGAGTFLIDSSQ